MIQRNIITNAAKEAGFDLVGITPSEALTHEHNIFSKWLLAGNNASLDYLARNVEKRFDSRLLVEGSRTIIICAISYLSAFSRGYDSTCNTKVASYALNRDYHLTIKEMLRDVAERIKEQHPNMKYRIFTDSAPLAEKSYAVRAGLGWIGRQSLLVNPKLGSMMHLGEIVIDDIVDEYDTPLDGVGCGSCHACVDACPNGAIQSNRTIDARRCISCRTIEREDATSQAELNGWIFGCDICQSVCPFNRHAPEHTNPRFDPLFDPTTLDAEAWINMSDEEFDKMAGTTPLTRAGLNRIKANICTKTKE